MPVLSVLWLKLLMLTMSDNGHRVPRCGFNGSQCILISAMSRCVFFSCVGSVRSCWEPLYPSSSSVLRDNSGSRGTVDCLACWQVVVLGLLASGGFFALHFCCWSAGWLCLLVLNE